MAQFSIFAQENRHNMKFVALLFTFIAFTSFGQDSKAQGILDKLSKKMKSQTSFYIEFSSTMKGDGFSDSQTGKGWVKGDKYYASFGENTMISNGSKTWTVVKEEKTVYVSDADDEDEDMVNPRKLMTLWESGFKNQYVKETTLSGTAVHVINLYPKSASTADYHTVALYVSSSSNELKKVIMKMKDGTSMTFRMTKFTSNPSVSDSKFVFDKTKYPGYSVVTD